MVMEQQKIKFTIRQDGTVTEEVMGVVGNDCQNLTKKIEDRLGVVESVEYKQEYYEQKQTTKEDVTLHMHQNEN